LSCSADKPAKKSQQARVGITGTTEVKLSRNTMLAIIVQFTSRTAFRTSGIAAQGAWNFGGTEHYIQT
jgi:hypothetical protein